MEFTAKFAALNIKGKAVLQLELAATDMHLLPDLAMLAGETCVVTLADTQQAIPGVTEVMAEYDDQGLALYEG